MMDAGAEAGKERCFCLDALARVLTPENPTMRRENALQAELRGAEVVVVVVVTVMGDIVVPLTKSIPLLCTR